MAQSDGKTRTLTKEEALETLAPKNSSRTLSTEEALATLSAFNKAHPGTLLPNLIDREKVQAATAEAERVKKQAEAVTAARLEAQRRTPQLLSVQPEATLVTPRKNGVYNQMNFGKRLDWHYAKQDELKEKREKERAVKAAGRRQLTVDNAQLTIGERRKENASS